MSPLTPQQIKFFDAVHAMANASPRQRGGQVELDVVAERSAQRDGVLALDRRVEAAEGSELVLRHELHRSLAPPRIGGARIAARLRE